MPVVASTKINAARSGLASVMASARRRASSGVGGTRSSGASAGAEASQAGLGGDSHRQRMAWLRAARMSAW